MLFKSEYKPLIYNLPQVKDTIDPIRFATTKAHQIPTKSKFKTQQNNNAKIGVKTTVLNKVANKA